MLMLRRLPALLGLLALALLIVAPVARAAEPRVRVLPVTGVVDEPLSAWLAEAIAAAERDGIDAVVLRVDTPGGSLEATRRIVGAELESSLPILAWVGPAGARATSAGSFIVLAAHVTGMAPGTTIGAATPVGPGGETIGGDLGAKVRSETVAWARSIAEARGRDPGWAEAIVDEARADAAPEAIAAGVVDLSAASIEDLLARADGRTVMTAAGEVRLDLAGAEVEEAGLDPFRGILHLLADPNLAFLLFAIGLFGVLLELQSPNLVTGTLGALAILLAIVGFGSLPIDIVGILLVVLAVVLFVLEITVASAGLLTIGGIIALVLGAAAFYSRPSGPLVPAVEIAWPVIAATSVGLAVIAAGIAIVVARTRGMPNVNLGVSEAGGPILAVGTIGEVRTALAPEGTIQAQGESWTARSADGRPLAAGGRIRIVGQDGLVMLVAPEGATMETDAGGSSGGPKEVP